MDYGIFFGVAFAESGDRVEIPVEAQPSNAVSFTSGYTQDYALNITTDPRAKSIERTKANYLSWAITSALGGLQRFGAPSWVGPSDNGGVALAYPKGARVQSGLQFYVSLIENNTRALTDSTAWAVATYSPANNAEALAGTASDLLLTPATLRYVLQNTAIGQQASTTVAGVSRYATAAETSAGTVANAAVTPAGLKPALDAKASTVAPAFLGELTVQPQAGTFGAVGIRRRTSDNTPGTLAFNLSLQADNSLRYTAFDSAGANGVTVATLSPYSATATDAVFTVSGSVAAGTTLQAAGRVIAGTTATEALSSTVRLATDAEVSSGAANVAVSPSRMLGFTNGRYLPISQPRVSTTLYVPGSSSGFVWYRPGGTQAALFFTDALAGADSNSLTINGCKDDGTYNSTIIAFNRATGGVNIDGVLTVGNGIVAPTATTARSSTIRLATQAEVNAGTQADAAVTSATLNGRLASYISTSGGYITGVLALQANDANALVWRNSSGTARYALATNGTVWALNHFDSSGNYNGSPLIVNYDNGETASNTFRGNLILGGTFRSTSRRDKKEGLRVMRGEEAIERLSFYKSWFGRWKAGALGDATDTSERPFFIADEVFAHAPEVVHMDEDGEPGSVGYVEEVPTLIAAVNFLAARVAELQAEVRQLRDAS